LRNPSETARWVGSCLAGWLMGDRRVGGGGGGGGGVYLSICPLYGILFINLGSYRTVLDLTYCTVLEHA